MLNLIAAAALTGLAPAALAVPFQTPGSPLVISETIQETEFLLVKLAHDETAHGEVLGELAELRRTAQHEAFRLLLADYRAQLALDNADLVELIDSSGGNVTNHLWLVPSLIVEADLALRGELEGHPEVVFVTDSAGTYRQPASLAQAIDAAHHNHIGVHQSLVGGAAVEGTGITIAIVDTGLDTTYQSFPRAHRAFYRNGVGTSQAGGIFGSRILSESNQSLLSSNDPAEDQNGHGTRVGSVMAGHQWAFTLPGIADGGAPDAFLRSYRIDDTGFNGGASTIAMGVAFDALAAQPDVRVANMSYDGDPDNGGGANDSIDAAVASGIFVTLSAGNDGQGGFFHAAFNALSIGASNLSTKEAFDDGSIFLSATGPLADGRKYPHLLAVGENVTSAVLDNEAAVVGSYGTSAAAGLTAGAAALVLQADPSLSEQELRALILNSSEEVTLGNPDASGYGYLASKAAFDAAQAGNLTRMGQLSGLQAERFSVPLSAGETFCATVVYNTPGAQGQDLDLRLLDPSSAIVAASEQRVGTIEQVRYTATVDGIFVLEVDQLVDPVGLSAPYLGYALATNLPVQPSGTVGPCPSGQQSVVSVGNGTQALPVVGNLVTYVTGCGLGGVNFVTAGPFGLAASFTALSDRVLRVQIASSNLVEGANPIEINFFTGSPLQGQLTLEQAVPLLDMSNTVSAGGLGDPLTSEVFSKDDNTFYVLAYSGSLVPTSLPGFVEASIGNNGMSLNLLGGVLAITGNGADAVSWGTFPGIPIGIDVYFQAAVFDFGILGLVPSNVDVVFTIP